MLKKPCNLFYDVDQYGTETYKNVLGLLDNPNDFAYKSYFPDGKVFRIQFRKNNVLHRENGPATVTFNRDGTIYCFGHYLNGELHNPNSNSPSLVYNNSFITGLPIHQYWYQYGKLHNDNGPSVVYHNPDGTLQKKSFYIWGQKITESEFVARKNPKPHH